MPLVAHSGCLLERGFALDSFNKASILEQCNALDSLALLSFLCFAELKNKTLCLVQHLTYAFLVQIPPPRWRQNSVQLNVGCRHEC